MTTSTEEGKIELLPCPFCGSIPDVFPINPEREGNAWGQVSCTNPECTANPTVEDGEDCADERGSDAYKQVAIERWNRRATPQPPLQTVEVPGSLKLEFLEIVVEENESRFAIYSLPVGDDFTDKTMPHLFASSAQVEIGELVEALRSLLKTWDKRYNGNPFGVAETALKAGADQLREIVQEFAPRHAPSEKAE